MARKKINDPQFSLGYALPEGVVNDFDIFYKPQTAPRNKEVASLINSLSNIVPTLATYDAIEEVQNKQKDEARAVEDFNVNKEAFATLVKNKKMPPGGNPHYFNKMMELDLATKARDFQQKFDTYYANNDLSNKLNPEAFKEAYKEELKIFYEENGLDKYDPLALNKAFFSTTSNYRDKKETKHNGKRLENIEEQTQQLSIKNYAGGFIEAQYNNLSIEEVHNFIKQETDEYIGVTKNPRMANELFISGLTNYIGAVNTLEGFDYATKLVDSLSDLKLGTGDFAGSNRANFVQKKLQNELIAKELAFYDKQNNLYKVKRERTNQKLDDVFFKNRENEEFNIVDLVEAIDENGNDVYNGKEKAYLINLNKGLLEGQRITSSTPNAIIELDRLKRENPYQVRDRALQFLQNGELTTTDYEKFSNSAGNYNVLENNEFFRQSVEYQTLKSFFRNDELAQSLPGMSVELPLIALNFERSIISYWNTIKDLDISPDEKQLRLNDEILLRVGSTLSKSLYFRDSKILRDIARNYRITIPLTDEEKRDNNRKDLPQPPNEG